MGSLFTPRQGYLHAKDDSWIKQAELVCMNDLNNKVLLYSMKHREYRTFFLELQKLRNVDRYVFMFIDITDIDDYHFILNDVNQMLEKEVEKHSKEKRDTAILLKQPEELLVHQSKLATMGNMINIITHQWKQPLSSIGLLAQNLEEDYEEKVLDKKHMKDYIGNILKRVKYMSVTIDDFRNFFHPSKTFVKFDVAEQVNSVHNLLRPLLSRNNITVHVFHTMGQLCQRPGGCQMSLNRF